MAVISMPSERFVSDTDLLERLAEVAVTLSRRLTRSLLEDIGGVIAEGLDQVAAATHADACQLIEFTESGSVVQVHVPLKTASSGRARAPEPWLVERLARGEVVGAAAPDEFSRSTTARREQAWGTSASSILGVPASFTGQVVCALAIDSGRMLRRWPSSIVDRLQLLAEILGAALQRGRHEQALRANVAVMEQLNAGLKADNMYLKEELKTYHDFDEIVGESAPLRVALKRLSQVAPTNANVLLLGPTGSGKELFARALHERSRRNARPLVRVNCAALPPSLVESELFGHEKGAFTGAVTARQGRFELADGGSIFLDEIGDLSQDVQVKFLRVLQEGEFERVGSSRTRKVDVRVIAATHRDLEALVAAGTFRADLYYRLSVYPIRLPSLQDRFEDIPRLVWFFIHRHQRELGRSIARVPQAVMDAFQRHAWPGNVRELENVVERAMIATDGDTLQLDEPIGLNKTAATRREALENLDDVQRAHIAAVLERCGWRINGTGNAAERLGVHPNTLRFRMKKLHLECPDGRRRPPRVEADRSE